MLVVDRWTMLGVTCIVEVEFVGDLQQSGTCPSLAGLGACLCHPNLPSQGKKKGVAGLLYPLSLLSFTRTTDGDWESLDPSLVLALARIHLLTPRTWARTWDLFHRMDVSNLKS